MRAVANLLALLLAINPTAAQSPCVQQIPVNVLDRNGGQVTDLAANSFDAQLRNRSIHLLSAVPEMRVRRVLILHDVSGSMAEPPAKWDTALLMVKDAANRLPPEDPIGFATFADQLDIKAGFSKNKQSLLDEVNKMTGVPKLRPHGPTALLDALADAASGFGAPVAGDVIYVITDGGDNQSKRTRKAVEEILQRRGIRLFTLILDIEQFGRPALKVPAEVSGLHDTEELAANTGGASAWYGPSLIQGVPETVQQQILSGATQLYRLMHSGYVLKLELPESLAKPEKWKLSVSQKKAKVLYPRQLFPCASASTPAASLGPQ